jgi:biotin-(acetyl-CoA carboxylase) ligase
MDGLEVKNNGRAVPLTLLPLKIGSLVATRIREALEAECLPKSIDDNNRCDGILMPMVTVKWPNDVLLRNSTSVRHEKIAGVLIETYEDWFLIGIGINVGYAPSVPSEGDDRGRDATCLARYCHTDADDYIVGAVEEMVGVGYGPMKIIVPEIDEKEEENRWIETSKQLAMDVAYDLHSWLHYDDDNNNNAQQSQRQIGESILDDWKSFVDWDMELTLRDTPNRERVTLEGVLEDGRVIVKEVDTGQTRTLVADYFL